MINCNRFHQVRRKLKKSAFMGPPAAWAGPFGWSPAHMRAPWATPPSAVMPWQYGASMSPGVSLFETPRKSTNVVDLSIFEDPDPFAQRGQSIAFPMPFEMTDREKGIFTRDLDYLQRRHAYVKGLVSDPSSLHGRSLLREGYDRAAENMWESLARTIRSQRRYEEFLNEGLTPHAALQRIAALEGRNAFDPAALAAAGQDLVRYAIEKNYSQDPQMRDLAQRAAYAMRYLATGDKDPRLVSMYQQRLQNAQLVLGDNALRDLASLMGIDYDRTFKNDARQDGSGLSPNQSAALSQPQLPTATPPASQQSDRLSTRSTGIYAGPSKSSKYL